MDLKIIAKELRELIMAAKLKKQVEKVQFLKAFLIFLVQTQAAQQRLNQQEEMIQKQEMMIKKLLIKLEENNHEKHPIVETKKVIKKLADKRSVSFEEKPVSIVRIEEEIVEDDTASSDLDKEIEEELKELGD